MEIASYVIGLAVLILGLLSAAFFSVGHRDTGLWTTCFAIVFAVIGGCCWYQDMLWKKDEEAAHPSTEMVAQRARVVLSNIQSDPLIPEAGKVFRVILTIKNIGPTPAKKCRGYYVIEPVKTGDSPNFSYVNNRLVQMGVLDPSIEQRAYLNPVIHKDTREPSPMTDAIIEDLKAGRISLITHGRIDYEDVFGHAHWFTFCRNLGFPRDQGFGVWPEHNDSDD